MKRGVVVELDDDFVTLLTPDGQFLRASNKEGNYELGEEISFFPLADKREEAAARSTRVSDRTLFHYLRGRTARIGALSAVAIIFFMISFLPIFHNDRVYAYMSIDINPSFEVSLDNHLKVISIVPLNDEANNIMESLVDWKEMPLDEIVQIIIKECKSDGYVYPGKEILFTTVMNETDKEIEQDLKEDLSEISSKIEKDELVVKTINSDIDTRDKAQKQGVSTGKYIELVEKQEETKEADDATQSDITPAPIVPIVPEKKEINTNEMNQSKEQKSTKPANNTTVQKEMNSVTKEKLNNAKQKIKENAQKTQQKRNENAQKTQQKRNENKANNHKQNVKDKQEERQENRNDSKDKWQDRKDKWEDKKDRNNNRDLNRDNGNSSNDRKQFNHGNNHNGWQKQENKNQAKKDRDDD